MYSETEGCQIDFILVVILFYERRSILRHKISDSTDQ